MGTAVSCYSNRSERWERPIRASCASVGIVSLGIIICFNGIEKQILRQRVTKLCFGILSLLM